MSRPRRVLCRPAFTLSETLVVLALIGTLSAMLFPVFAKVRAKTRETPCLSNLRQIGMGMGLYAQDYDGLYPYGADTLDKRTAYRIVEPEHFAAVQTMPYLHEVMIPYIKSAQIWRCPADTGFTQLEEWPDPTTGEPIQLNAPSSCFETFGTSYTYNTELAFNHKLFASSGYRRQKEVGPENIMVLSDLTGAWHGTGKYMAYDYMTLLGDGHVKHLSFHQWSEANSVQFSP